MDPQGAGTSTKVSFATWRGLCQAGTRNCSKGARKLAVWGGFGNPRMITGEMRNSISKSYSLVIFGVL